MLFIKIDAIYVKWCNYSIFILGANNSKKEMYYIKNSSVIYNIQYFLIFLQFLLQNFNKCIGTIVTSFVVSFCSSIIFIDFVIARYIALRLFIGI